MEAVVIGRTAYHPSSSRTASPLLPRRCEDNVFVHKLGVKLKMGCIAYNEWETSYVVKDVGRLGERSKVCC